MAIKSALPIHSLYLTMSLLTKIARSSSIRAAWRNSASCRFSSAEGDACREPRVHPVYVHHLSKVVLQHLQVSRSNWVKDNGLDKGLRLNSDGTFVLRYPPSDGQADGGRIWTSYDATKKQHWLSVYRQKLVGRFLMKDSLAHLAGQDSDDVEQSVRSVVDQMIRTLSELESPQAPPS